MIYGHLDAHACSGACVIINVAENLGQKEELLLIKALGNDGTESACKVSSTQ